ncbi:MAG TPA: hypothetical protein VF666_06545 [Pyrinomonadaceae bacterium]|jgi:hypothetical protein
MKRIKVLALLLLLICTANVAAHAQGKGVDQQNDRIRDNGNNRAPATNGGNVSTGTGRGIDFGGGRTVVPPPVPNPYRLSARRDALLEAIQELMRERKMILDEAVSKPDEGVLISQPYTFIKGAVVAQPEINRYAEAPDTPGRGWTRGRYTLIIEVQPIDGVSTNVSVNARVEGRTDGAAGAEWVTLQSTGMAEQEFIIALVEKITGGPPPGREP